MILPNVERPAKEWVDLVESQQARIAELEAKVEAARKILEPLHDCDPEIRAWLGTTQEIKPAPLCHCDGLPQGHTHAAETCVRCGKPLPPLAQWSGPGCPACTEKETKGEQG